MTIIKNAIRHMEVRIVKYVLAGGGVNIQTSYSEG
jgi:hypothetical protein